jgi:hypothetical protein
MKLMIVIAGLALAGCPKKQTTKPDDPKPAADAGTDDVVVPVADAAPPTPKVDPLCAHRPEKAGPFVLDASQTMQRHGYAADNYIEVDSTKEKPIEVCGLEGVRKWIEAAKCPDGSAGSQQGRVGSVGLGGRCNTMIEKFKVGCPDGSINMFFAVHFCGPGESM